MDSSEDTIYGVNCVPVRVEVIDEWAIRLQSFFGYDGDSSQQDLYPSEVILESIGKSL